MSSESKLIRDEIPDVEQIFRNECWFESKRRGQPVERSDAVIRERVAGIILSGAGAEIRRHHMEPGGKTG